MLAGSVAAADARAAQDPIALARTGTAAIENRRFGDALEAFTKAAAMQPGDASLCFGAGVAAFMLGQNDVAQSRFECALALNPNYLPAAVWLGDLHYRAGRLHEAIAIYETARQRSPGERELQEQLADWRKEQELQSRFHEIRTEHFTALFEVPTDEPLAREVVERLEAAYRRVGNTLGVYPRSRLSSCSTPANNSVTSRGWPHGQRRRTTDAFGCRSVARWSSPMSSIACCHTNSFMPWSPC